MSLYICNKNGRRKGCKACAHGSPHKLHEVGFNEKCDSVGDCTSVHNDNSVKVKCKLIKEDEKQ
jgi:hypothetical protein